MKRKPGRNGKVTPRKKKKRRLGTLLFLIGLLAVLGSVFVVGALAGRLSLRPSASMASTTKNGDKGARPAPPQPTLTFYRELTAPLTPPPLPPKPAARAEKAKKTEPAPEAKAPTASAPESGAPASKPARDADGRYTVQVGSYNARAQAEALRSRLGGAGHDAYVSEGEAGGLTRYRVRVGSFATMEEARQAAVRLGSDAHVATYVTTR